MTETTGLISVQNQNQYNVFDSVGVLSSAIEMKLKDVVIDKVALYSITNDPPQGEIWVRGPSITQGYYNQPTVTKETIDENDWLRTGDVGELQEDGTLRIIDRIKNLVKLSGGEYVALEKLEVIYRSDDSVNNLMVYASSLHSFAVAVVLPKNLGVTSSVMLESLLKQAKGKLANAELIKKVLIVTEDWTPENGLLTSANKLNRKAIFKKYEIEINALFAEK